MDNIQVLMLAKDVPNGTQVRKRVGVFTYTLLQHIHVHKDQKVAKGVSTHASGTAQFNELKPDTEVWAELTLPQAFVYIQDLPFGCDPVGVSFKLRAKDIPEGTTVAKWNGSKKLQLTRALDKGEPLDQAVFLTRDDDSFLIASENDVLRTYMSPDSACDLLSDLTAEDLYDHIQR